jgi:integrase
MFSGCAAATDKAGKAWGYRVTKGKIVRKDAYYWLPIFALWHGCRLEEIGGARAADIRSKDGISFLDLTNRKLKNAQSRRELPIHPRVVELGFLDYAEKRATGEFLFPELPHQTTGESGATANFSRWWGRWSNANGFPDPTVNFHSFRHTFKRACRGNVKEEMHDLLTGHMGQGGIGRSYGRGAPLAMLASELAKVDFPTFPKTLPQEWPSR